MHTLRYLILVLAIVVFCPSLVQAQGGVKVVPIGDSIKPEKTSTPKKRRRRYYPPVVKSGENFLVELGTALSLGLTKQGDVITLRAAEEVGKRSAAIQVGATGQGRVTQVNEDENMIIVTMEEIDNYKGESVEISGQITVRGEGKKAASASVGEKFTATLDEKIVVKRQRRKKKNGEPQTLQGFVEVSGKKAKADIDKGKAKGKVQIILEAPKGFTADDINTDTVKLAKVNGGEIINGPRPTARTPKQGDSNKNGTTDWKMYFEAWDFIKNQREGMNTIVVEGDLKNGQTFEAVTRVKIDY